MRDIDALIAEADEQLEVIRGLYTESLRSQNVPARLQTKIKNILENQRSALEYLAHAIVDQYGKQGSNVYYPVARKPESFDERMNKNMKGVATNRRDIRDAIEQRQPYQPGYEWLGHLVTLTNENKHQQLTPQERTAMSEIRPAGPGEAVMGMPGAQIRISGNSGIRISGNASISFRGPGQYTERNIKRTVYIDWLFTDPRVSALSTLQTIQQNLPALIADVTQVSGL